MTTTKKRGPKREPETAVVKATGFALVYNSHQETTCPLCRATVPAGEVHRCGRVEGGRS